MGALSGTIIGEEDCSVARLSYRKGEKGNKDESPAGNVMTMKRMLVWSLIFDLGQRDQGEWNSFESSVGEIASVTRYDKVREGSQFVGSVQTVEDKVLVSGSYLHVFCLLSVGT